LLKFDTANQSKDSAIKDLLFEANQLNLTLNFQLFEPDQIKRIDLRKRLVLTYFGDTRRL
jgi:hypothetical protein